MFFTPLVIFDYWLARKIDFLVRVSRRVPEVPRFGHCRSTVRQPRWTCTAEMRYVTMSLKPSRARRHTMHGKPHFAAQAFKTERHYCGTNNRCQGPVPGGLQREPHKRFVMDRNVRKAGGKCPVTCPEDKSQVNISAVDNRVQRVLSLGSFTYFLTLYSECFSTFPHGTCSLSVSW